MRNVICLESTSSPCRWFTLARQKNILDRAKDHTFGHPGTAALAISKYTELVKYRWEFHYMEYNLKYQSPSDERDIIALKLGEEIWRANNGWPLLCVD